jgi:hypothetical protein
VLTAIIASVMGFVDIPIQKWEPAVTTPADAPQKTTKTVLVLSFAVSALKNGLADSSNEKQTLKVERM